MEIRLAWRNLAKLETVAKCGSSPTRQLLNSFTVVDEKALPPLPAPPTEVLPFLEKAAAANDDFALYSLGILYEQGQGVVPDYAQARYWYERAAAAGNADAMYDLGMLYYYGKGVTQDYGRVREWSQKAAEAGSTSAMFRLGELFQYGRGVAQAREWYQKAADTQAKEALWRLPSG
jgi:TPR repeat protein